MQKGERLAGGHRLDPPRAGPDRALGEDRERPDLGSRPHVRAAAELDRPAVDVDDADDVAVLLHEQHRRAEVARLGQRRLEDPHRQVREDPLVDPPLHFRAFLGRDLHIADRKQLMLNANLFPPSEVGDSTVALVRKARH